MSDRVDEVILSPEWKELVKVALEWEYGSKHTHKEISAIIGIEYGTREYYHSVNSAADELKSLGKRIRCVYNEGYYVLKPSEYPEAAYLDTKKSANVLKEGLNSVYCAPVSHMDDTTKKRTENIGSFMAKTYVSLVDAASEVKHLAGIKRNQKMLQKAANGKD